MDRHIKGGPINDPENEGFPMIFHNWEDEIEGPGSRKPKAALAAGAAVLVTGLRQAVTFTLLRNSDRLIALVQAGEGDDRYRGWPPMPSPLHH